MEIEKTDRLCPRCHVALFRAKADTDELFCLECRAGGLTVDIVEQGAGLSADWISPENQEVIRRWLGSQGTIRT
jgi:hypothetical protein